MFGDKSIKGQVRKKQVECPDQSFSANEREKVSSPRETLHSVIICFNNNKYSNVYCMTV